MDDLSIEQKVFIANYGELVFDFLYHFPNYDVTKTGNNGTFYLDYAEGAVIMVVNQMEVKIIITEDREGSSTRRSLSSTFNFLGADKELVQIAVKAAKALISASLGREL